MIDMHVLVPTELAHLVDMSPTDNFKIIENRKYKQYRFYIVETTEEEMTALVLKLGSNHVWKR